MTLRRHLPALAAPALLTLAVVAWPASAQSQGNLRIAVRIVNDCGAAAAPAAQPPCQPAQQRSDPRDRAPPQVQALTPPDPAPDARADRVTVTF
ncbi:hypothetical protein KQ945_04020 [Bacillus subtilis subsp. subtilis]|nr:hypothetical protein [Bacillus subtilis subsp. subtilis]